jgi:hypothetical protein
MPSLRLNTLAPLLCRCTRCHRCSGKCRTSLPLNGRVCNRFLRVGSLSVTASVGLDERIFADELVATCMGPILVATCTTIYCETHVRSGRNTRRCVPGHDSPAGLRRKCGNSAPSPPETQRRTSVVWLCPSRKSFQRNAEMSGDRSDAIPRPDRAPGHWLTPWSQSQDAGT